MASLRVYCREKEKESERADNSVAETGVRQPQVIEVLRRSANRWLAKARVRSGRPATRTAMGVEPGARVREERMRALASLRTVIDSIIVLRPPSLGSFLRPAFTDQILERLYQTHHLLQGHSLLPVFYVITALLSVNHMFDGLRTLNDLSDVDHVHLVRGSRASPQVRVPAIYIVLATLFSAGLALCSLLIAPVLYLTNGSQSVPRTRSQSRRVLRIAQRVLGIDPTCGAQWVYLAHRMCSYGWFIVQVRQQLEGYVLANYYEKASDTASPRVTKGFIPV